MHVNVRNVCAAAGFWLCVASRALAQEPATITGKVTGDGGQALGQVEVAIPAMGLGALTKDDGSYAIVVPGARVAGQTATLLARRLGYKSQSAQVTLAAGGVTHDFTLAANPLQLGEVVVTGAGTATEAEKLGNVRNNVSADLIERSAEQNLVQALAAKAPNVTVIQQSGDPGASSYINIRGASTILGSNQPLFVVDGLPIDNSTFSTSNFNTPDDAGGFTNQFGQTDGTVQTNRASDLNPNDIESVEILKGPAAAAIYGARAAAGVVLITTKSGHPGATRFSFRSSTSFDNVSRVYPLQTSFGQGLFGVHADTSVAGPCAQNNDPSGICRRSWGPAIPAGATIFDHAGELYQTGHTLDNGFTLSGGNDRTTFYLAGDNNYNQGIIVGPSDYYSRTTVRVKASHRLVDNLNVGANVAFADARGRYVQRGNNQDGIQLGGLRTPPDFNNLPYLDPVFQQHRSYRFQHPDAGTLTNDRGFDNPFFDIYQQLNSSNVGRVFGNVSAEYLAKSWLKFNYTLGVDYTNDERLEGCPISASGACNGGIGNGGRVIDGKLVNYQIDHNLTGTVTYAISTNVSGRFTVGQNLNARNLRQLGNVGRGLVAAEPFKVSNTVVRDPPIDAETVIHDASWFGQGELDLYGQLYLTGAARNDGSSTFGEQNLRSWFPKASVAWEFSKVTGDLLPWLSFGKARIAYGEAGQEPLPYLTSQTFSNLPLAGQSQGTGFTPTYNGLGGLTASTTKAATTLKPERSQEFETGLDLGFFKDRGDASVTWYNKISADVILIAPVSPSTGFSFQAANAARLRNRGWEASLNFRPLQAAEYGWEVGLQWARNRGMAESLGGQQFIGLSLFKNEVVQVGQPIGALLGTGFMRCGVSSGSNVVPSNLSGGTATLASVCTGQPTGAMYVGPDGLPLRDPDTRIVMDPNYAWTGSVRTSAHYRKIQISGLLDIRHGGQIWNGTKGALFSYGTHGETAQRANCPTPSTCSGNSKTFGQGDWYPGPVVGPGAGAAVSIGEPWYTGLGQCAFPGGVDETCIEDGGFVKLREISVTYTIDAPWVQRSLGFTSIDLRVAGRNLHTWTKYTGYDPETNLGGAVDATQAILGVDYFNNPGTRSFVFAVTLNH